MIVLLDEDKTILDAFDSVGEFKFYMQKFVADYNHDLIMDNEKTLNYDGVSEFEIARDFKLKVEFY